MYWDLLIGDVTARGLEVGSFSSGHVADPFELESKKYSWERAREDDEKKGNELVGFSSSGFDFELFRFSEFSVLRPGQDMATEASEEKHSKDFMAFD